MIHLRSEPATGAIVGRYRLIAELARGGMGIVYLASTHGPGGFKKLFALKQLRPDLVEDGAFLRMFLDEARVAARLSHPNIVQTNDIEQLDGRYFIAMEYLDGRSLSQILRRCARTGGFPAPMSLLVLRDALGALDYAHTFRLDGDAAGIVHRDVSPQNIFVTFDGCAKVIDFGIAKARDSVIETQTGVLKGKVQYMAPEQIAQRAEPRSDVFSAGAVLFEILAGRRLWAGLNEMEIMARLTRAELPSVAAGLPDAPQALIAICQRALAPRVEDRWASAVEMREALDEYLWSARLMPAYRDVGAVLAREFGAEREAARAAIDRCLADEVSGGPILPLQPAPRLEASGLLPLHSRQLAPIATGTSLRVETLPSSALRIEGSPWRKAAITMPLLTLLGILLGLAWRGVAPPSPPTTTPPRPSVAPAAAPSPSIAPLPTIALAVNVTPSSAQLFVDGEPLGANPFLGRYPKDQVLHRVRASAPGFFTKERVVSFADNAFVALSLDPKAPPIPRAPAPPPRRHEPAPRKPATAAPIAEPPPPPPPPAPVAAPTRPADIVRRRASDAPARRSIDAVNPYGDDS